MIYEIPSLDAPIRQGDIFVGVPRVDLSLDQVVLANPVGQRVMKWADLVHRTDMIEIIVPARTVAAIVVSQDCDAVRSRDITLCEIRPFRDVEKKCAATTSPKSWVKMITQHARQNQKWFYLPPDNVAGFTEKMAADFLITLRLPRLGLEANRSLRPARLNEIADEHFRERIAEFYRRYPYDEWYPLQRDEFGEYKKEYPDAEPFDWQKS